MAHREDVHELVADDKQNSVDTLPLAGQKHSHFLAVEFQIRVHGASPRVLSESLNLAPDHSHPAQCRRPRLRFLKDPARGIFDVAFRPRFDHDAVSHFRVLTANLFSSSLNTSSNGLPSPRFIVARLSWTASIVWRRSACSLSLWYERASCTTSSALPLMVSTTGSPVSLSCLRNSGVFRLKSVRG